MNYNEIITAHRDYLFPCVTNYYKEPLVIDHAKDQYVYDLDGKQYLDFFGGILTVSIGHCNDKITSRICNQLRKLQHTSTLYPTENIVKLAKKLAEITPGRLTKSFFTGSGSEADETAILLAKLYTGRQEVIALRHAYSGRTALAMTLTGHSVWRQGGTHIIGIKHAHNAYCYRCAFGLTYPGCELKCATDLEELIMTTTSGEIAAFLAEPIQGVGGFITPPKEYFKVAVEIIKKHGGLFICDEVQTGFGRTGGKMFGIEHWDVEPDIMTFAKGIANGIHLGATIATPEVADALKGFSISTFGGNPVSCEAALATISVIEEQNIVDHVKILGDYLCDKLNELKDKYRAIGEVRGMGLMQALEIVKENKVPDPDTVTDLFERTKEKGLLIGKGGLYGNVIRLAPPMTIDKSDIDVMFKVLDASFQEI